MKRIIWTELSQQTRKEIFEYWNSRNKSKLYSRKLNILFNAMAKLISQFSEVGIITEWEEVRAKSVKDYFSSTLTMLKMFIFFLFGTREGILIC